MKGSLVIIIGIVVCNTILSFVIFLLFVIEKIKERKKERHEKKISTTLIFYSIFICLTPPIGVLYLLLSCFLSYINRKKIVDMNEISFNRQRDKIIALPDEEVEYGYVPMEDAVAISDTSSLRKVVIDSLKNESIRDLSYLNIVITSKDSETSHYAASVLMDRLSEYRGKTLELFYKVQKNVDDIGLILHTMEYMDEIISSGLLHPLEYKEYMGFLEQIMEQLFTTHKWYVTDLHYFKLIQLLLSKDEVEHAMIWLERAKIYRKDELNTYKSMLHYYYYTKDNQEFYKTVDKIKESSLTIDSELMDLFHFYKKK